MSTEDRGPWVCPTCGSANSAGVEDCGTCGDARPSHVDTVPESSASEQHRTVDVPSTPPSSASIQGKPGKPASMQRVKRPAQASVQSGTVTFSRGQLIGTAVALAVLFTSLVLYYERRLDEVATDHDHDHAHEHDHGPAAGQQPSGPSIADVDKARMKAEGNPDDLDAQLKYANILHDARMTEQAVAQYNRYLAKHPENVDARVDLGICYFELGNTASAISEMERALTYDPTHQLGHFNLGVVALNSGDKKKAAASFARAIELGPQSTVAANATRIMKENGL